MGVCILPLKSNAVLNELSDSKLSVNDIVGRASSLFHKSLNGFVCFRGCALADVLKKSGRLSSFIFI